MEIETIRSRLVDDTWFVRMRGDVQYSDEQAVLATDGVCSQWRPFINTFTGKLEFVVQCQHSYEAMAIAKDVIVSIRAFRLLDRAKLV